MSQKKESALSIPDAGMESFDSRLKELIGKDSLRSFALSIDASEGGVRKWFTQGTKPSFDKMVRIARLYGVNLEWLCTGEGPKLASSSKASNQLSVECEDLCEEYSLIDGYHTEVSTGHGSAWDEQPVQRRLAFRKKWLRFRNLNPEHLKVLFAKGDSMEPTIHSGDSILVDTSIHQLSDGSIFVLSLGGDLYAKRLQKRVDGGIEVISDNREYSNQVVPANELDQLQIIGKVVWIGKDLK